MVRVRPPAGLELVRGVVRGVVRVRPPAGANLVGSTGHGKSAGGYLALKAFVLKGQGGGVRRVHLFLDLLLLVRTYPA